MNKEQREALRKLMDIGDMLSVIIVHHKSSSQPLQLPDGVVEKLNDARQAVFAAQRLIEP